MTSHTTLRTCCLAFLLLASTLFASMQIQTPEGWERIDDPDQLPKTVKCVMVGPSEGKFIPSINVATQETHLSTDQYFKEAMRHHERLPMTRCQKLGTVDTADGKALLMQVDQITNLGEITSWQLIEVIDGEAYVITATALQEEFKNLSVSFSSTLKSLRIKNDLKTNEHFATKR
jgi:hypothetical protein